LTCNFYFAHFPEAMPISPALQVRVCSRSDGRYAETPLAFRIGERTFRVERVLARGRTPESEEFIVACADGNVYRLVHLLIEDIWKLGALPLRRPTSEDRASGKQEPVQQQKHLKTTEEEIP